ncbi:MAG: ribosome silencing factor [Tissierellia bacterium]|nr:ribosome silencing factor [Tissierellia bacterium]
MSNFDEKLEIVLKACDAKQGVDIKTLDIRELTTICDAFVVVSGNSTLQVKAIADEIEDKMDKAGYEKENRDGYQSSRWVLLDYGDIIVHIFHKEERGFYNIERLWNEERKGDANNE